MSTKPTHSAGEIAADARHVLASAKEDVHDKEFSKRIAKGELASFEHEIESLEGGAGARSPRLHAKVAAGAHVALARSQVHDVIENIREDAKVFFPKNDDILGAFGVGMNVSWDSTPQVKEAIQSLLESAHDHAAEAKKVGLDAHGVHDLEHMKEALDGLDLAQVHASTARHTNTTATESLAHAVAHEAAHLRLVARRVFRSDEAKLARYKSTLPRHEVKPRAKAVPPTPPTPPATG
jgi:hypothetical protein